MTLALEAAPARAAGPSWRERLASTWPIIVLLPSIVATLLYVFVFTGWSFYISLSNSTLMPTYG